MKDTRIEWIDIAKGIGILLVIAGHTFYLGYSYPLYAFHMPLFFFLSGLLYKENIKGFKVFLKSKTKTLIKPWLIMLLISALVCVLIPCWRKEITLHSVFSDLYTANTNTFQNSSLWYLVCFYFVLLIFYFINKIKRTKVVIIAFILVAISLLWIKSVLNKMPLPFQRLPFKIDSALVALVFFSFSYWNKKRLLKLFSTRINVVLIMLFTALTVGLCIYNGWSNINSLDFGRYRLLYYPIALISIFSVCLLSEWISTHKRTKISSFLQFYGKNSLLIFGFQSLFIRLYLLLFNNLKGLNMQLYGNNPVLYQVGAFVVVSFLLSPAVVYLFGFLRKKNIMIL